MKACSSAWHRPQSHREKVELHRERKRCLSYLHKERPMLKTLITISTVLLTTAAFAQGTTKSPGSSGSTPGHTMQKSTTSTGPGASEYAPGHQKKGVKGHSASAPGHQTTTGSAAKKK
jgi:hypothetical protein